MAKRKSREVNWICADCGNIARYVTICTRRVGAPQLNLDRVAKGGVATFHDGVCDLCGRETVVTQPRDFGHPDYRLINWPSIKRAYKE